LLFTDQNRRFDPAHVALIWTPIRYRYTGGWHLWGTRSTCDDGTGATTGHFDRLMGGADSRF
jgi:hypothetical protein